MNPKAWFRQVVKTGGPALFLPLGPLSPTPTKAFQGLSSHHLSNSPVESNRMATASQKHGSWLPHVSSMQNHQEAKNNKKTNTQLGGNSSGGWCSVFFKGGQQTTPLPGPHFPHPHCGQLPRLLLPVNPVLRPTSC